MQPSTPEQKQVAMLRRATDRDLKAASSLVKHAPHLYESVGFSSQQAAAKYRKAMLIAVGPPAPFIHSLAKLLAPLAPANIISLAITEPATAVAFRILPWRYATKPTTRRLTRQPI